MKIYSDQRHLDGQDNSRHISVLECLFSAFNAVILIIILAFKMRRDSSLRKEEAEGQMRVEKFKVLVGVFKKYSII
jgi:hypothetical protein